MGAADRLPFSPAPSGLEDAPGGHLHGSPPQRHAPERDAGTPRTDLPARRNPDPFRDPPDPPPGPPPRCPGDLTSPAPAWNLETLRGRLAELSGGPAAATLTAAFRLVVEAQSRGEPAAWITTGRSTFFPPDAAASGCDLEALAVIRLPSPGLEPRAADVLVRSGGFGLIVLDLVQQAPAPAERDPSLRLPVPVQSRLAALARRHRTAILCLTEKPAAAPSLGTLVSLRAEASRVQVPGVPAPGGTAAYEVRILKVKGPGSVPEKPAAPPPGCERKMSPPERGLRRNGPRPDRPDRPDHPEATAERQLGVGKGGGPSGPRRGRVPPGPPEPAGPTDPAAGRAPDRFRARPGRPQHGEPAVPATRPPAPAPRRRGPDSGGAAGGGGAMGPPAPDPPRHGPRFLEVCHAPDGLC